MYICLYICDVFEITHTKINSGTCCILALTVLSEAIKLLNNFVLFTIFQKLKAILVFFFRIKKERNEVTLRAIYCMNTHYPEKKEETKSKHVSWKQANFSNLKLKSKSISQCNNCIFLP